MHEALQKQINDTSSVIRELVQDIDLTTSENVMIANAAQQSVLSSLGDMLEARKQELIEEMRRTVLEYSAKISVTNHLLRTIGREVGMRDGLIERIKEGETT